MRTVLVCVRSPLAAQNVATAAARLGLAAAVRTAVSDPEAMLRLAERPADVVLADTAITRPDSVGFTRRVLARSPGAVILLLGAEEPGVASAAVAAGARGLLQGGDHDLVSVVAKAILLLGATGRSGRNGETEAGTRSAGLPPPAEPGAEADPLTSGYRLSAGVRAPVEGRIQARGVPSTGSPTSPGRDQLRRPTGGGPDQGGSDPAGAGSTVVPAQRGDDGPGTDPRAEPGRRGTDPPVTGDRSPAPPGDRPAAAARAGHPRPSGTGRRPTLTEREMQVLLGMAEGKSNAEIGRDLFVSEDTVKTHARRLFRKLGARDRAHAVAAGFRAGLVN